MGIDALRRAVFFDRDGVLNEAIIHEGKPYPPRDLTELRVDPSARALVSELVDAGFVPVIVTNQPDVARGTQKRQTIESINIAVARESGISNVYTCFHDTVDNCVCRKPKPGLLFEAARDLKLDLAGSYMIGDRSTDVEAGFSAGCATVFIDRRYSESVAELRADVQVQSLAHAIKHILRIEREPHAIR